MSLPRQFFAPSFRHRRLGWFFAALVAIIVYMATFATAAEAGLSLAALRWDRGLSNRITVEIPAVGDEASTSQDSRVEQALGILRAIPDVASANPLPDEEVARLLKPWISDGALVKTLPVPVLIDVERQPGSALAADEIEQKVKNIVHDATVDDHAAWLADLGRVAQGFTALGALMILLAGLTLVIGVSLLCRAIMATERETVSLLHVMGAEDGDIARHFEFHARRLAAPAAAIGFGCAVVSAAILLFFLRNFLDAASMPAAHWLGLGCAMLLAPLAAIFIAALSARLSVLNFLHTMP